MSSTRWARACATGWTPACRMLSSQDFHSMPPGSVPARPGRPRFLPVEQGVMMITRRSIMLSFHLNRAAREDSPFARIVVSYLAGRGTNQVVVQSQRLDAARRIPRTGEHALAEPQRAPIS